MVYICYNKNKSDMATKQQIDAHFKYHMRRKAFNLAVLQLINNDPAEFEKRVARVMENIAHRGDLKVEAKQAINEFIENL